MSLEIGELYSISPTSVGVTLRISNESSQEPLLVAERLNQEIITTLQETTSLNTLEYDFFEGWKSKTGAPGFAVYGKSPEAKILPGMTSILTVRYKSLDLADRTDISERFFSGPEPVRSAYLYNLEVSALSPLVPDLLNLKYDPQNPYSEVTRLLENLAARPNVLSRVLLPGKFYQQFEGDLPRAEILPVEVKDELARPDNFTLDGRGRYLAVVHDHPQKGIEYLFGHFRSAYEGRLGGVGMTGSHHLDKGSTLGISTDDILGIYGKGLEPIFTPLMIDTNESFSP